MRGAVTLGAVLLAAGGCRPGDEPRPGVAQAPPPGTRPDTPSAAQSPPPLATRPNAQSAAPPGSQPAARPGTVAAELAALIARQGSVTFSSYDGKWMGGDTDSEIMFLPDGAAHTFRYADDILSYRGTFTVEADGTVVTHFPTMEEGGQWPTLLLRRDGASLLLFPKGDIGPQGNAVDKYWPFRRTPPLRRRGIVSRSERTKRGSGRTRHRRRRRRRRFGELPGRCPAAGRGVSSSGKLPTDAPPRPPAVQALPGGLTSGNAMPTLDETLDRLASLPMFEAERAAAEAEINRIESELGVVLPSQYVAFLRRHGYAGWDGSSVLGVRPVSRITGAPSRVTSDCIARTKRARHDHRLGTASLPPQHVVIATDGGGGNFVLFCEGTREAGQVHWYAMEDSPEPIDKWLTFQDYLGHRISLALEG